MSQKQPEPIEQLFQLCLGFIAPICLNVVAQLSVAEQLADGPRHVDEIAKTCKVNADALHRVMRAVSTAGVFSEVAPRRFAQTPSSDLLRRDHPPEPDRDGRRRPVRNGVR